MRQVLLFIGPIFVGLVVFSIFLFFFSKANTGTGALQVTSVPLSNVYLNGQLIGKTPLCKCEGKDVLPTGDYTVKLVPLAGNNLSPYEEQVTIQKGILTVVDRTFGVDEYSSGSVITLIPLQDTKAVQVFVTSFPSGASVAVDGNTIGITPLLMKSFTDSNHDIVLSKAGYQDKTIPVHAVAGYQLNAEVTLGLLQQTSTQSADLQNASLTPTVKTKILILDTPTGFLRVRSEPSLNASETAQVEPGNSFDYLDEQDGWYEIQMPGGQSGWISTEYAKKE